MTDSNLQGKIAQIDEKISSLKDEYDEISEQIDTYEENDSADGLGDVLLNTDKVESGEPSDKMLKRQEAIKLEIEKLEEEKDKLLNN